MGALGQKTAWSAWLAVLVLAGRGLCWMCPVEEQVCEIWLEVEHAVTMMDYKTLTVVQNGLLFPWDHNGNLSVANSVPKEKVITADGWPNPRVVIAVNGTVPGPLLELHEGQTVRLHLTNKMMSEATSLHFHGQFQRGTPWMDGVSFVTQCPVLPGQTFTHQFKAEPAGTFWYHAHTGAQSSMGMHGGFVVHPAAGADAKYDQQFTINVEEYNHDWDSTMAFMKMEYGMYVPDGTKESGMTNLAGGRYSMLRAQSLLFNGRGRYHDASTGTHTGAPLEVFTVKTGGLYRFRMIHAGSIYPFRVSVDGHKLKLVATDGLELHDPPTVDAVVLTTGERYDFEIQATGEVKNYWIRGKTLEIERDNVAEAILHYDGADDDVDPTTTPRECTAADPCVVVNCPFLYYPADQHTTCYNVERLDAADAMPDEVGLDARNVKEYFLNYGFPGTTTTPASVNGVKFQSPRVSALTQPLDFDNRCPEESYRCTDDELCMCTGVLDLEHGDVVQMVITNLGNGKGWDHPMHMHGHSFWVLKVGYPQTDNVTGRITGDNMDIDCRGNANRTLTFCNNATWADPSWSGNTVPGLDLERPVHKDTVNVPTGGYVVLRIKADNPGVWAMHCHINLHLEDGMFMLLNESYPHHPPPPPGFQSCGNSLVAYPGALTRDPRDIDGGGPSSSGTRLADGWAVVLLALILARQYQEDPYDF